MLYDPAEQGWQVVAEEEPVWVLYVPAAQERQVVAPTVAEKVPAGQLKHKEAPILL